MAIKVIDYQEDPTVARGHQSAQAFAEALRAKQAMRLTAQELKIRAREADTEEDKFRYQQQSDAAKELEEIIKAKTEGANPSIINIKAERLLKRRGAEVNGEVMHEWRMTLEKLNSLDQEEAMSLKDRQAIEESRAKLDAVNRFMNRGQETGTGSTESTNSRASLLNGPVTPSMNFGGVTMVDPQVQSALDQQKAVDTQLGQEEANQQIRAKLLEDASGSNYPVGASISGGGLTYTPNPKLDEAQITAVTGADKFEPLVNKVTNLINSGVLKQDKYQNKFGSRFYKQLLAEGGGDPLRRLLTKDETPLEELASAATELRKYSFTEGGKNLTPTELGVVQAGLSFVGKSDKQIMEDFNEAINILREKKIYILGGANVSKYGPNSPGERKVKDIQNQERTIQSSSLDQSLDAQVNQLLDSLEGN